MLSQIHCTFTYLTQYIPTTATGIMATTELPKKYRAAIYDKPGTISTKIVELDMPEPGAGEVLINLTHTGVCHSDLGVMMNSWSILPFPTQSGQVGGHEGVGKIVKMGPGTDSSAVKIGDRVGIKWMAGICETCEACRAGMDANCFNGVSSYLIPESIECHSMLNPLENLRVLHPRYVPAICAQSSELCDPNSRRSRLCGRSASLMRWCDRLLCIAQVKRQLGSLGRYHGRWWRSRPLGRTIQCQRNRSPRHWH